MSIVVVRVRADRLAVTDHVLCSDKRILTQKIINVPSIQFIPDEPVQLERVQRRLRCSKQPTESFPQSRTLSIIY